MLQHFSSVKLHRGFALSDFHTCIYGIYMVYTCIWYIYGVYIVCIWYVYGTVCRIEQLNWMCVYYIIALITFRVCNLYRARDHAYIIIIYSPGGLDE